MFDAMNHEHAFPKSAGKIDPNSVVSSIKENIHAQELKEVSIISGEKAKSFAPMQWPLFDDGKPVSTNAMGYEIGGYYKRHQEALRQAHLEAERAAEQQRIAEEQEAARLAEEEAQAKEPPISAEELESIRNIARNEGYTEGMSKGHAEGYEKGVEQGRHEGISQGQKEGLEQGYKDGFRQGRDEGFGKGQEEGIAAGNEMVTMQADRFRHLADMLAHPLREMDETVTDEIVYIISRLARVILKRELKGDIDCLKYTIEKAVGLLPEAKKGAEIHLSENDYALMVASIGRDYMNAQNWDFVADANLEEGDILVNTKISSVQWKINDRIDELISEFLVGASDAVASARKEVIEGAPDYDQEPTSKPFSQRNLMDMSERIASHMADTVPPREFAVPEEESVTEEEQFTGPDVDALELEGAQRVQDQRQSILGSQEVIEEAEVQ